MGKEEYSLHFYPDENRLDVKDKSGLVVAKFEAWGGDKVKANAKPGEEGYGEGYEETNKGTFLIQVIGPVTTSRWPYSTIKWGEWVQIRPGDWTVLDLHGADLGLTVDLASFLQAYASEPEIISKALMGHTVKVRYYFNDFGHTSIRMFRDLNNNGKLDKDEALSPHYLHTSPITEWAHMHGGETAEKMYELGYSHGCIHVYPSDIDTLLNKYIVRRVTKMTIY